MVLHNNNAIFCVGRRQFRLRNRRSQFIVGRSTRRLCRCSTFSLFQRSRRTSQGKWCSLFIIFHFFPFKQNNKPQTPSFSLKLHRTYPLSCLPYVLFFRSIQAKTRHEMQNIIKDCLSRYCIHVTHNLRQLKFNLL